MSAPRSLFLVLALAILVASCSYPLHVAGVPTFGRTHDIPAADIEAAIATYRGLNSTHNERIPEIEVISRDEIRFYQISTYQGRVPSNYESIVRVKGKWQLGSVVLAHSAY